VRRTPLRRLGLLALIVSSVPSAASPETPGPVVDWPQVLAAIEQHPLALEAGARAQGAAGAVTSARELPNPTLSVKAGDVRAPGGAALGREWEVGVELQLEFLNGRWQRIAAARAAAAGAGHEARAVRLEVVRELRRAFVAAAHGQAILEARIELEAQVALLTDIVRRRAERGEGRPTEELRFEIELERLRAAVDRARAAAEAQRQRLGIWMGRPVAGVAADLARSLSLEPFEPLRRRVVETSPQLQAGRARVEAAEQSSSAERWDRLPRVGVAGARSDELDRQATTVTATVALPLWNWNLGRVRQADAAVAGERARLDAATRTLTAGLAEAWQGCSAGQAAATRFREEILPRAEGSARLLGRGFELGETGLLDVIDGRRVLLDARTEYLDLLLEMQNACGDLAALAGLELP
jgi:cobalt-zinc-cadmium efflux system outer membrane protein